MRKQKPQYPWSVLGIEPTQSELGIKRAYAAKLKTTRPEDDMEAFQSLVTARDVAIRAAKQSFNSIDREVPASPDEDEDEKYERDAIDEKVAEQVVSSPASDALYAGLGDRSSDVHIVRDFLYSLDNDADFETALAFAENLRSLPLDQKSELEAEILEVASNTIGAVLSLRQRPGNFARQQYIDRRQIICLFNQEYGWSEQDARASELVIFDNPDFADQLQLLIKLDGSALTGARKTDVSFSYKWWSIIVFAYLLLRIVNSYSQGNQPN